MTMWEIGYPAGLALSGRDGLMCVEAVPKRAYLMISQVARGRPCGSGRRKRLISVGQLESAVGARHRMKM